MRVTLRDIRRLKDGGQRSAMVTAFGHPAALARALAQPLDGVA